MKQVMYRYEGYNNLTVSEYCVVKETPCGYWISPKYLPEDKPQFIRKNARASFAYPTKKLALQSYIRRKMSQIEILEHQLRQAKMGLRQAKEGKVDDDAQFEYWTGENRPEFDFESW